MANLLEELPSAGTLLSIIPPERLVPMNHPIRQIKPIVDRVLEALSPTFTGM
ncbi:MAG: hypothetical protein IIC82_06110 [Chloroflexi bacterium]|nr:hypothetical protein [Chloroflexota bacterium]